MPDYIAWNNAIFDYFFSEENNGQEVIFSVDDLVLINIGKSLGLDENYCIKNFCETVAKKIVFKNRNNKNIIKLNQFNYKSPEQTAILALFILAASRMHSGIDKETNKTISTRNYFVRLRELLNCEGDIYSADNYGQYFDALWTDLNIYLNETKEREYGYLELVTTSSIYNIDREKKDRIGIPIFQSMISLQDKCYLTQLFQQSLQEIKEVHLQNYKFSTRFKRFLADKNYKNKLLLKIKALYDNWDGIVLEIDINGKITQKIPLRFAFKQKWGILSLFFILSTDKVNKKVNKLRVKDRENNFIYEFNKNSYDEEWFDPVKISIEEFCNYNDNTIFSDEESKLNFLIKKQKFILFKKHEDVGINIQVSSINLGDDFSIIIHKSSLNELLEELAIITGISRETIKNQIKQLNDSDYYVLQNVKANKYVNRQILIKNKKSINLLKGLKLNRTTYLKGAEPIIEIPMPANFEPFDIFIDNKRIEYNKPIILKEFQEFCTVGEHEIKLSKILKKFIIKDIETSKANNNYIYNVFDLNKSDFIGKQLVFYPAQVNISGFNIYNLDFSPISIIFTNKPNLDKINYIYEILNSLQYDKQTQKNIVNSDFLKLKSVINHYLERINDKNLLFKFNNYFLKKHFISNIEFVYLNKIIKELEIYTGERKQEKIF